MSNLNRGSTRLYAVPSVCRHQFVARDALGASPAIDEGM